jgi:hypothetical protein
VVKDPVLRVAATQGVKALIAWTAHKTGAAAAKLKKTTTATTANSTTSSRKGATRLKPQCVPGFDGLSVSVARLVSWLVMAARLDDVSDRPHLFAPLVKEGYHKDLMELVGMGQLQVRHLLEQH